MGACFFSTNACSIRPALQDSFLTGIRSGLRCSWLQNLSKEIIMEMPPILQGDSLTRLLQGAFVGFVATVVIGFGWGGWTLGSTAKQLADKNASAAVVAVLAPMCADKFRHGADATANMAELKKVSSWMQDSYIEKGGWATFPGNTSPDRSVAQACATLLTAMQ
jgi:hypothetical protein